MFPDNYLLFIGRFDKCDNNFSKKTKSWVVGDNGGCRNKRWTPGWNLGVVNVGHHAPGGN